MEWLWLLCSYLIYCSCRFCAGRLLACTPKTEANFSRSSSLWPMSWSLNRDNQICLCCVILQGRSRRVHGRASLLSCIFWWRYLMNRLVLCMWLHGPRVVEPWHNVWYAVKSTVKLCTVHLVLPPHRMLEMWNTVYVSYEILCMFLYINGIRHEWEITHNNINLLTKRNTW